MSKLLKQRLAALFMDVYKLSGFRVKKITRPLEAGEIRTIAIYSTTALGDLLLNTPAIVAIKKHFPAAKIILVVNKRNAQLVEHSGLFDEVLFWNGKVNGVSRLVKALRREKPDATFILHSHTPYDIIAATLSRSAIILKDIYLNDYHGHDTFILNRFLSGHYDHRGDGFIPVISQKSKLLALIGIDDMPTDMVIPFSYEAEKCDRRTLGVHLGASSGERCWPIENFVTVIRQIMQTFPDVDIALLGGPGEVERNRQFLTQLGESLAARVTDFAGKTSLKQLTEKIASLTCLLVGDTGPMHISIAVRTPTIIMFPSLRASVGTRPQQDQALHQVLIARSEKDNMAALDVESVNAALLHALSSSATAENALSAGGSRVP